ncbi:hypothetical protein RRF57_006207 [Xylaria bambusicola]|uniref:Uncharacterized protein n=1 Tax=Xylaria bambusicola TaxID=326684 RepID=A0AAN7UKT9_9PEZI
MYLGGNSKRSAAGRGLVHKRNRHGSSETIGIKRRSSVLDKLIITSMAAHSAQELCDSETSWGPDTVSTVENLFCDMETKTLYPVCAGTATTSCFDLENESLILPDGTQQHDGIQARSTPKAYNSTMYW